MNSLLLSPSDVLFFRDGRPMGGSLAGHGSAWPLPNVVNAALHAALHRSDIRGHEHRVVNSGDVTEERVRTFGSLVSAGPFPVKEGAWWFARPADAQAEGSAEVTYGPNLGMVGSSSLPKPLRYGVCNQQPPSKDNLPEPWMDSQAWNAYLTGQGSPGSKHFARDEAFSDTEHAYGIAIEPESGTVVEGQFYSASYLRLKDRVSLGVLAKTHEKSASGGREDLIPRLFPTKDGESHIVVGGQQRVCRVNPGTDNPLPRGLADAFIEMNGKMLVKWVLLSAAIWPEIQGGTAKSGVTIQPHTGGWLPNWISPNTGEVLLKTRGERSRKGRGAVNVDGGKIGARLVASIVPKPIPVTGWGLAHHRADHGAKSTHLAVPAGAVYYFEADDTDQAKALAKALNWNGDQEKGTDIINRRSTLMGEKGFGIGVCGTWKPYQRNEQKTT